MQERETGNRNRETDSSGPEEASAEQAPRPSRFWRIVGLVLAADIVITLILTLVGPGFSGRAWSDALCTSAVFVALAGGLPFLFDTGRGVAMLGRLGRAGKDSDNAQDEQRRIWREEHRKREQGITITFALALAAFLIGLVSVVVSLW
jgi:hypothetical protein